MITTRPSFAAVRGPVDREVFEFGFNQWRQAGLALRRLWQAVVALPDRGHAATAGDVPPEYFRFPPF
jgi:hypothetical protein